MHLATITASVSRSAGGLFPLIRGLNLALLKRGMQVSVLGLNDAHTEADAPSWSPLPLRTFAVRGPAAFGYAPGLRAAQALLNPDITHVHGIWMYPSLANAAWARRTRRPYVISPQGMLDAWALQHAAWKKRVVSAAFEKCHLAGAACLHAVSASEAEAMRAFGLRNPIGVIPNGIDLPAPRTTKPPPWAGTFPDESPVLLFLGRLHPKKGLPALLDAWAQLVRPDRPAMATTWSLAIAGWDQLGHRDDLERQAAALGISTRLHFCGPLHGDAKAAAFQHAAGFVLPSFSEGMPAAVLEAWSYGLPVVMTPACNLPEGFQAQAALAVNPDAGDLARGLHELTMMPPAQRSAMGARGEALVRSQFAWDSLAARMARVYEWALNGGDPPPDVRLN